MASTKRRANVVLTDDQERVLYRLSKASGISVSELVRKALDAAMPIFEGMLPTAERMAVHRLTLDFRLAEHLDDTFRVSTSSDRPLREALDGVMDRLVRSPAQGPKAPVTGEGGNPPILTGGSGSDKSLKTNVVVLRQGGRRVR